MKWEFLRWLAVSMAVLFGTTGCGGGKRISVFYGPGAVEYKATEQELAHAIEYACFVKYGQPLVRLTVT